MKTFKFIGKLIGNYEWTVQVDDNQDQDDAYCKLIEKGLTHDNPTDGVSPEFDGPLEAGMEWYRICQERTDAEEQEG